MTPNQTKALAALLTCKSRTEAARACGLSTKTLQGYEKDPAFADALERGRREALADAAHSALLDYGLKFAEITDVNRRLDKLEGLL